MSEVLGGVVFPQNNGLPAGASDGQVATATFRGEQIQLRVSQQSLFDSAVEEMSFSRSTIKDKDLKDRKLSDPSDKKARLQAVEQALSYLEKARNVEQQEQLRPFLNQLLGKPEISLVDLRQLAAQFFQDISQQYLALAFVLQQLRQKRRLGMGASVDALEETVEAALEEMMQQDGPSISAGINVASVASAYAGGPMGSVNQLRQFYRDAVLDYGSLSGTFKKILEQYGEDQYSDSVAYLVTALGSDLASEGPSMPKERLNMIVEDLFKLQSLESLDDETTELLGQLHRIYRGPALPSKLDLMGKLLELLDKKWINATQLNGLTDALHIGEDMAIYFFRGFKELIRLIPIKIYRDPFERDSLINAIQECLDRRIENELD